MKFETLNDLLNAKIQALFEQHKEHHLKVIDIKEKYSDYLESEQVYFASLDDHLNYIRETTESVAQSPLKQGDNGFWYFCWVIRFTTMIETKIIKANCPVVIGIKLKTNGYEIKLKDKEIFEIRHDIKLNEFFDLVTKEIEVMIKNDFQNMLDDKLNFNLN